MPALSKSQLFEAIASQSASPSPNPFPRIVNQSNAERASIYLLDAVSYWTDANAYEFERKLSAIKSKHIDLYVNSPGGAVFEGLAIYNLLKDHPARVTVHVIGLAASIASVIAMAGDEILISDGAMMMIHSPSISLRGSATELRKQADLLDQIEESIVDVYHKRTNRDRSTIAQHVKAETWFTASQAILHGYATKTTPKVTAAATWSAKDYPELPIAARAFGNTSPVVDAAKAAQEAAAARHLAAMKTQEAKAAAAALPAAAVPGRGKQEPFPQCPGNLEGKERKAWFAKMNTFSADTVKYSPDRYLQNLATHEITTPGDREIAKAELTRRGWVYAESSRCWSQSQI